MSRDVHDDVTWLAADTDEVVFMRCWLQLIRPDEMCSRGVDEQSMMTYLSQFPSAKLKPGAPLRPRTNPHKVRAYGPGNPHTELYSVRQWHSAEPTVP